MHESGWGLWRQRDETVVTDETGCAVVARPFAIGAVGGHRNPIEALGERFRADEFAAMGQGNEGHGREKGHRGRARNPVTRLR